MAEKSSVDKKLIRDLAALMEETGLTEIELGTGATRLRVARGGTVMATPAPMAMSPMAATLAPDSAAGAATDLAALPGAITSPMVGTVYLAAEPGAPAFVRVGDTVSAGQTLMIIEAMKTMNPIPATVNGKVTQILISDGTPVEFGEVLIVVE